MRTAALAALAAGMLTVGVSAPSAQAGTLVMLDGPAKTLYQSWVDTSALPVPSGPIPITLRNCRSDREACMENDGITIPDMAYIADTAQYGPAEIENQHALFMHEVFHVLDLIELRGRGGYRQEFQRIMHYPQLGDRCWTQCGFITDSEIAADAYALCATRPHVMPRDHPYKGYGKYKPTDSQHERVCQLLDVRLSPASSSSSRPTPGTAGRPQHRTQRSRSRPAHRSRRAAWRASRRAALRSEAQALRHAQRAPR
jgi:hypothetical protein